MSTDSTLNWYEEGILYLLENKMNKMGIKGVPKFIKRVNKLDLIEGADIIDLIFAKRFASCEPLDVQTLRSATWFVLNSEPHVKPTDVQVDFTKSAQNLQFYQRIMQMALNEQTDLNEEERQEFQNDLTDEDGQQIAMDLVSIAQCMWFTHKQFELPLSESLPFLKRLCTLALAMKEDEIDCIDMETAEEYLEKIQ